MFTILDRILARLVPKATVSAGCSTTRVCRNCGPTGKGRWVVTTCCLNEGCTTSYGTCGGC